MADVGVPAHGVRAAARCRSWSTRCARPSRSRGSPTCCCRRAPPTTTTASAARYPYIELVYWSRRQPVPPPPGPGPAAPGVPAAATRSSCTSRTGRPPPGTPTSSCPRPSRWSATTSAPAAQRPVPHRHAPARRRRTRRPATTTPSSPRSPTGSASADAFTEGRDAAALAAAPLRPVARGAAARGRDAGVRRVLGDGPGRARPAAAAGVLLADFRADPDAHPLGTPSGRIELHSATVAAFGLRRLPRPPASGSSRASGTARAGPAATRCVLHRQQPGDAPAQPARLRPAQRGEQGRRAASRCGCTPTTPPPAGSPTASSSASSTTAAPAWRACAWTTACCRGVVQMSTGAWFSPVEDPAARRCCARRATSTCSPPTSARRASPRAARVPARSSRCSAGTAPHRSRAPAPPRVTAGARLHAHAGGSRRSPHAVRYARCA